LSTNWPPTTVADLERAIANGLLSESHFVDLKRELPAASKNTALAVDLAAFSVDAGSSSLGSTRTPFLLRFMPWI
jgi:hypothetical protein